MGTGGRHSHGGPSAAATASTRPGLPLRRYSVPEVVMRKASLRQRAAAQEAVNGSTKKQDNKSKPGKEAQQEDPKQTKNISVISERSVVKCETTSQCFSMTLSSSTTTECKVSVCDVSKVPEPCSKTSEKKRTQFSKDEEGLDTITEHSCSTTVENSDAAVKEMTEEDHEVQHIMSDKRSTTPACCRRHQRLSSPPCCASPPCEDVSPTNSSFEKNRPDSASSSVTLDQSVSDRSSSTQDSTLSVRSEENSPCEGRQKRTSTPYNRLGKKTTVIRDVCGNKVHVLSETSSFIVFETPSPSPSPPCQEYPNESCCCVCTCCKSCERECNVRSKRISQTTQTTEDKTTSVNERDRRSTNVRPQTEQSSVIVDSTVNREVQANECGPDLFGVDSNGNVTFCSTGVEMHQRQEVPKSKFVQTSNGEVPEKEGKPTDTYMVKTETIEKWENDKREWTEKKVSHGVQHQSGPPIRDSKTYNLSNRINIANNNPTLVASEIVEIPLSERHAFCPYKEQNAAGTCPMCQEEKKDVTLPSIKPYNDAQNLKNEADFWNKLMGQNTRAQTNIPKISETQPAKETATLTGEDLYPWSKLPEKSELQSESAVVDVTTTVDGTEATVVPRYSAVPRTVSMLVNTSSADVSDSDSECLSCADSLENVHLPRKSNKHDSKPVRGHVLLAESAPKRDATRRVKPPKVFFIRLSEDDGVVEGDLTPVSEYMPEKLKEKLVERHTSVRHTEHCRHHEAEGVRHSRSAHHERLHDIPQEDTKASPHHKSMASQAVIKECATKSTSTQRSRSKREVPAIVRVHKCHLEEDVRPMFKAKPYKGVTASTLKTKPSKPQPPPPEPSKPEPKSKPRKRATVTLSSEATVHQKQDQSTHMEEMISVDDKGRKEQPSRDTQTTPSTRKEDTAKALQRLHNFNHAMQTQTTPPRSVETLTVNLEEDGKRVAKSSQTEVSKNRPTSRQTTPSEKTKSRKDVASSPATKMDSSKTTKAILRQTQATTTEVTRKKDVPKTDESTSETETILKETTSRADRKLESSPPTPQRLTTPRRSGGIARFRHKFPVIPEEQREVSPSSPNRSGSQRRSPAVITSLNAMSQTDPNDEPNTDRGSSSSNTDGSRSDSTDDSQQIQYSLKVHSSPDFNSQSQQTDAVPRILQSKQPQSKTSGGTQTDHSDINITKQHVPAPSICVDAATSTDPRKSDASTSTLTPRSSATTIQKEITKTSTTIQTRSTSSHSERNNQQETTITQKETTKSMSTQSSPPAPTQKKSAANPTQQVASKSSAVTKPSTNAKPSITATPATPKITDATSSASTKTKDVSRPVAPKTAATPVKQVTSATSTERTRGSWASRGPSLDSNLAYNRRKAAAIEHVNRLQRLLHHGPAASLSACDDISSGGSCPSDSTNYMSPPEMSTSPGWGGGDGRVTTSASLIGRRQIRSRPTRRDTTVSTDRHLYRHHEPPRLSAPGPPPSDGAGWTVTVAGGSNVGTVVGGVSSSVDPNNGAPELEMRVMIAEASTIPTNRSSGSSRWSLTIRNQPAVSAHHQQAPPDSAPSQNRRPPSLTWPRVQHLINGSVSPRQSDSSTHQLSVTGSAIKRNFSRHVD